MCQGDVRPGGSRLTAKALSVSAVAAARAEQLAEMPTEELRKHAERLGLGLEPNAKEDALLAALLPYAKGLLHRWPAPKPLPLGRPTVSFKDVRAAIPKHCFERSLSRGLCHLAGDLAQVAALGYAATWISSVPLPAWAAAVLWAAYWFVQGTVLTGVWVLAHECGHQSFSESERANNFVGWICHSALLVPYHSWRITHAKHHANTGSCEHDEVFCPPTRADCDAKETAARAAAGTTKEVDVRVEMLHESPFWQALSLVMMLLVGWMPGYLFFNATGPKKYRGTRNSHFNPWAPMFEERDRLDIVVSDIGFFAALTGLGYAIRALGFVTVVFYYLIPYMITNLYLVLITFLQHTDVFLPHFRGKEWEWFRGALCTVDRSFGAFIDHTIHHISDTHVCHHLFSKMPFYHAQEATLAIRKVLGDFYLRDDTPVPQALWRAYTCCGFIEDDGDIVFYKSRSGL